MQSEYKYRQSSSLVSNSITNRTLPLKRPPVEPFTEAQDHIIKNLCLIFFGMILPVIPLGVITNLLVQEQAKCITATTTTAATINTGTAASTTIATTTTATWTVPIQCNNYTAINDSTRLVTAGSGSLCDNTLPARWYRFVGSGTILATSYVSINSCTSASTATYSGIMPTTAGATVNGSVCVNYAGYLCYSARSGAPITVTNCGSYYVYYLLPITTGCNVRYCTTN